MYERWFYTCGQYNLSDGTNGTFRYNIPLVNCQTAPYTDITNSMIQVMLDIIREKVKTDNFIFTLILEVTKE